MNIIPMPQSLLRAMSVTWSMDVNHSHPESPFTGVGQTQRGQLERWKIQFKFHNVERVDAGEIEGFFLKLEGIANPFSCYDPARKIPAGVVAGDITFDREHLAGERIIELTGFQPDTPDVFRAGDWIQVGHQLTKVSSSVDSDPDGKVSIEVWPKLWATKSVDTPVIYKSPVGVFRFTSGPPEWEVMAGVKRAWSFSLSGVQEVIADGHSLTQS